MPSTRLLLAALLSLSGCRTVGPLPAAEFPGGATSEPVDALLVASAAAVLRVAQDADAIWTGFWPPSQAFLIYREGGDALLITDEAPPPPWVAMGTSAQAAALQGRAYVFRGSLPGLAGNFDTAYRVGAQRVVTVNAAGRVHTAVETLFHEAFHAYQARRFGLAREGDLGVLEERPLPPDVLSAPAFEALSEIERRLLADAIGAPADRLRPLLGDYLTVRRRRLDSVPADVQAAELAIERKEGSASWVGGQAAGRATDTDLDAPSEQVRAFLTAPVDRLPQGDTPYGHFRSRAYGSGAALAWALTRMGVPWREPVESGASFLDLLAREVATDTSGLAVDTLLARLGVAAELDRARAWSAREAVDPVEAFYALGSVRLTLVFPKEAGRDAEFVGRGSGLPVQPEDGVVIFPGSEAFSFTYGGLTLEAERTPYLLDFRQMPEAYRVTLMLSELPVIDRLVDGHLAPGGRITAAGLTLRVDREAEVDRNGGVLVVRVAF